ncbi:MAG: hypothetical protein HC890_18520 [Chloroflexaceae bacterium]|nr:hypothetical protein [Chloroflexaceae bacterium]
MLFPGRGGAIFAGALQASPEATTVQFPASIAATAEVTSRNSGLNPLPDLFASAVSNLEPGFVPEGLI